MTLRVAGCDLGKSTAKFVVAAIGPGGALEVVSAECVAHEGNPTEAFRDWYRRAEIGACAVLGATGLHADELVAPVVTQLPEDACIEAALALMPELAGPLNIASVGARGYAVFTRGVDGRTSYLENDKCSSGTGETMVKIAGRFGLGIEEADRLAFEAVEAIPITARCSVFAKSEMTHFGNQGRPADALFRGYFASVANYVAALLARARVEGAVYAIGGCVRIRSLVRALSEVLGEPVRVPERPMHFEAVGAMRLAADQLRTGAVAALPADPDGLVRSRSVRFRALEPASRRAGRVTRLEAAPPPPGAEREPSVLGLDLGSTGSKAVLTSIATGDEVLDVYDRTRGNPVEAAGRLLREILARVEPDVRAIGLTGSGREAVATVLRAAYPPLADRIVVINEIVAHATAAVRCDPDGGRSLSVVEIGGQDAKFIQIADGHIVESDMNKACSAGTGSFLEEQAYFYGIRDIEEFTRLAAGADRPPELGQMCTVFVAEAAAEANKEGFELPDLFGGFQYSVIHNYMNRVMGQRTFGEKVFFQGKPATGPSLAWTLAAVADRDVVVPPNPGAMGAWGIGLCAIAEIGAEALGRASPFDLRAALGAAVVGRGEFQCRDKRCETLCSIQRTEVEVGGTRQTVLSGGACPKYEISTVGTAKLPKEAPSAFDERTALLARYLKDRPGPRVVGIPQVGACFAYLPWLVTFVRELGLGVRVLRSDATSLARGEERCFSFDACAPIKIAHGVLDADVDTVFVPKLLSLEDRAGSDGKTCPMEQGLPEMVREALRARGRDLKIVSPCLPFASGLKSLRLLGPLFEAAERLGADKARVLPALRLAADAQRRFEVDLEYVGARTLAYGRAQDVPVVVVCGALHVVHDPSVNAGIPRLLRENGVLALPMDCYPLPAGGHAMERLVWADSNRAMRVAVAARERGDVYPLLLSSFGCGPGSFAEQIFSTFMQGYPHTALESDGHGGTAGYVTRVQAFLHTVRRHDRRPSPVARERLGLLEPLESGPIGDERDSRLVMFPVGDRLGAVMASVYRAFGFDAVATEPTSAEVLAVGRRDCSGKECIPYQLIWGSFRKYLEDNPPDKRTLLLQVSGEGMCRNCMFTVKDRISVEHLGLADKVAMRHIGGEADLGKSFMHKTWTAIVVWDTIKQLADYHRALERREGEVDELYHALCDELDALVGRPGGSGLRGALDLARERAAVLALVDRASEAFARIAERAPEGAGPRTVFLTGDIYVRLDPFAGDRLANRLAERRLRVLVEPVSMLSEYMAEERLSELLGLPKDRLDNALFKFTMARARREIHARVRKLHPWLPDAEIREVLEEGRGILDRYPQGEAPVTVGSVLHHWRRGLCDGVVVASPWGCGPSLISESLLRHQRDIPMLFVYSDGSPIDERRLNAFAFRLLSTPPRSADRRGGHGGKRAGVGGPAAETADAELRS